MFVAPYTRTMHVISFRTTEAFSEKRIARTNDILRGQGRSWRHQPWP